HSYPTPHSHTRTPHHTATHRPHTTHSDTTPHTHTPTPHHTPHPLTPHHTRTPTPHTTPPHPHPHSHTRPPPHTRTPHHTAVEVTSFAISLQCTNIQFRLNMCRYSL